MNKFKRSMVLKDQTVKPGVVLSLKISLRSHGRYTPPVYGRHPSITDSITQTDHSVVILTSMSFQGKGFWMSKDAGCLTNGEIAYDNSARIEPKRPHQWFLDCAEAELLPNKKQAVEVPSNSSFSGVPNANLFPWGNVSSFQSVTGQFTERLFDTETVRTINLDDRNITSFADGNLNMGSKAFDDPFGNDSSFGLSISHTLEDPRSSLNYGGIRKVKVSQVRDSENAISVSMGPACARGDDHTISTAHGYNKIDDSVISMGLAYSRGVDNVITMGDADNYISMGHIFKGNSNTMSIANVMSVGQTLSKEDDNNISMGQSFNKADCSGISTGNICNKGNDSTIFVGQSNNKDCSGLSMGHSFDKGESNIISFGSFNEDDDANGSGRLVCSYELLMGQPSVQRSNALNRKDLVVSDANVLANAAQVIASGAESVSKKKEDQKSSKKMPTNNFPSNVRSLLSTGILDGVPVKYIAWSREKELRGVIKGSGYLCGCQLCNFSKVINAYEFERHAGCKTKHPNNHIYFENGKTIYGIVQELRSTPQNMLFDIIQTITGSPINQKSFRLWKESFMAATRELQRIYGKDEGKLSSSSSS
ncbi:hypothetical protein Nepgr_024943 [Nepenthes gracilis]|uniref:Tify domain-containing protein n=1 Tax=Nepenthes gracilis TaxID=150966 RepID=A0AAD3Y0K4_NEPGR|nr:hypothetical protein Nepgr_024943 [Nepenthes gracilis]